MITEPLRIKLTEHQVKRIATRQAAIESARLLMNECLGAIISGVVDPMTVENTVITIEGSEIVITPNA